MKKSAFTLIELLVVIAIIAILAAILFPVFAQAKASAKAAADLSNVKQGSLAVFEYSTDTDDLLPQQAGANPATGIWGYNYMKYVPWNWSSNPNNPLRQAYSNGYAGNSMYPYIKNYGIYKSVGISTVQDTRFTGEVPVVGINPEDTNYAFNGFLSSYSSTAIANVAMLPLITEANGDLADHGGGMANPSLTCATANQPCTYQSDGGVACVAGNGGSGAMYQTFGGGKASYWVNKEGQNWAFADGHAKFRPVGQTQKPNNSNYLTDPWTGYDNAGHAGYYWSDGCFAYLFRPDYTFGQ